jgi:hypothetical protein
MASANALGEIEKIESIVFGSPFVLDLQLVWLPEGTKEDDYIAFILKYPNSKRVDAAGLDGYGKHFYMCYVEDCFDPPIAVIRADDENEAVDIFVDTFSYARVTSENYGSMEEFENGIEDGTVGVGDGSNYYDAEAMRCKLVTGEVHVIFKAE